MTAPAIRAEGLSKQYRIGARRSLFGRLGKGPGTDAGETLWALSDVSFEVAPGEVVGVIGRNGAGKSTLLKVLSRITQPTRGRAVLRGRLSSLLEVGTGFHPELTGRENVYMNAAILGMRRADVQSRFDQIVEFAGVERFIDTPLKRYSSGMQVRLAFAVAAHLEPEILIIDEVLAVGDAAFQRKCLGKMENAARAGRTVLFVSHNMTAVRTLCGRCLVLNGGRVDFDGGTTEGVDRYLALAGSGDGGDSGERLWEGDAQPGTECIRMRRVSVRNAAGDVTNEVRGDQPLGVELEYEVFQTLRGFRFHLTFETASGDTAFRITDHQQRTGPLAPGVYTTRAVLPPNLLNRTTYRIVLGGGEPPMRQHLASVPAVGFTVVDSAHDSLQPEAWPGVVAPKAEWTIDVRASE